MIRPGRSHWAVRQAPAELVVNGCKAADVVADMVSHVMPSRMPGHAGARSSEGLERCQGSFTIQAMSEPITLDELIDLTSESREVRLRMGGEDYLIWIDDGREGDHLHFSGQGPSPHG